ncbi:hypothetical protein L8T14_07265 [Enterobacter bugandensis]|uniref:hypothetical protein n=1 Tax=Enterobacter bugandensis TaxID=881260 RepID=UPI002005023F|nr:hypothetical protein [Enterobacter bugandensis]MCK6733050.1 hypothetical protein [Enterobacter bugandensis]
MSTITKEWLQQKIADMEADRDEIPFGLDEDDSNTLAAFKLALASLEAEPVITVGDDGGDALAYRRLIQTFAPGTKLYTASPAPVSVMDEAQSRELFEKNCMANIERNKWHPDLYAHLPAREQWAAWEACRNAMLHGAEPISQTCTLPNGYCVMPLKLTAENGAKGALSGEFHVTNRIVCQSCAGEGCEDCNDEGGWNAEIPVSWDTIKRIHESAVEACALPAAPQQEA